MNVKFEKEICSFLNLPSIPLKEWDGETAFDKGVAIVKQAYDGQAYAVARFDPIKDAKPTIIKVFDSEPFFDIEKVLVVPDYMETSVETADLDEESKKKAEELAKQAEEIENDGTQQIELPENPYLFDNITNDEEAIAFIEAYNKKNGIIKGQVPKKHETILNRLLVIYSEQKQAAGNVDE